jgi:hypothetical protein
MEINPTSNQVGFTVRLHSPKSYRLLLRIEAIPGKVVELLLTGCKDVLSHTRVWYLMQVSEQNCYTSHDPNGD